MLPIYSDLLKMWSDLGYNIPITEGKFWTDNNIIKAFTRDGELHNLYRCRVQDDLQITITKHKDNKFSNYDDFETWWETIDRLSAELDVKVAESLDVIKDTITAYKDYDFIVLTSTGKDSMVTLDLVQKVIPNVRVLFNNTSLDTADTYRLVKSHKEWEISNPKEGFYNWVRRMNYIPNRVSRGCCTVFKEGNSIEYLANSPKLVQFMGVRNDESNTRSDRQYITHNPKWGDRDWYGCLPIRKWSELDVWLYIIKNDLEINNKYKKGYCRVGCGISCPYATKYTWVLDKYWYPEMRARWEQIEQEVFLHNQGWVQMNCTLEEYAKDGWNGTLYRPEPTEEVINEFMEYKGITDRNIALQYFNKTCCECGKNVRQNDVLAMNLKMIGRSTDKIYCKKYLMAKLNMNKEEWDNSVADFKDQGCKLF